MARCPSKRQLQRWLDGEAPELDEHIDMCEKCAATIESMTETLPDLRPALMSILAPQPGAESRITERLNSRMQDRRDMSLFGSLLGIGVETGRVVLDGSQRD